MKILKTFYFIIYFAFFVLILSCNRKIAYVFNFENAERVDYIITCQKVNFHLNDSIYPLTVFIMPNGAFTVKHNFQDSLYFGDYFASFVDKKIHVFKYKSYKDSLLNLNSYFPVLVTHDSSVINHYDNPESFNYKLRYEPNYSYMLHLTNEPILSSEKDIKEIRVTSPDESQDFIDKPKTRYTVRLKMLSKNSQLFLTEGIFDSLGNFNITRKDSCIVKEKDILKITKAINKIDFKKEYYFAELGLEIGDKFLFEYKNADYYYVLERAIYNRYNHGSEVLDVYALLLTLKNENLEKK